MKKIGIVSMVRNESDIIELFIKINLRSVDRIFIVDHCSEDGTREIAIEMQKIYPQIEVFSYSNKEFNQSQVITSVVREISAQNILDYIIPLDADEFISEDNSGAFREIISSTIGETEAALAPWQNYCPISLDYSTSESPLYSCFKKRSVEPRQFYKVILGNEYAKECIVTEGNHSALSARFNSPQKILEFKVNHVPVRSPRQILRKALMGSYALALKQGRQRGEGYHWDEIAKIARDNDYDIGLKHLMEIALYYAAPRHIDIDIDFNSPGIGKISDNITFSHLAKPSLIRDYDLLTLNLIDRIAYSDKID